MFALNFLKAGPNGCASSDADATPRGTARLPLKWMAGILLALIVPAVHADPGLVGEYFNDIRNVKWMDKPKDPPFLVRTDPQINFATVTGEFYGSHLNTNFGVRWTGVIHIDQPGKYRFHLQADDDARLTLNNKQAMAFTKAAPMTDRTADITFDAAGDYPLKLELVQSAGSAGCILRWQPPGANQPTAIPVSALSHAKTSENIRWDKAGWELFASDHHAYVKLHGKPYEKMDYGPFLSGTFKAPMPEGNTTNKGIIVSLNKEHTINILFDTEMCRYSAGWTGDYIDYHGVAYDGAHVAIPTIKGTQIFGTPNMPGWEHNGSWKDPRPRPYGNLPGNWCHYRGLYHHGEQTVLSYEVNGVGILDWPSATTEEDSKKLWSFVRTLQIEPTKSPLTLLVDQRSTDQANATEVRCDSKDVKIFTDDQGRTFATIPSHDSPEGYAIEVDTHPPLVNADGSITYWTGTGQSLPLDFSKLVSGGPLSWGDPIVTQGQLGTTDGPYVVDTITAPEKNPSDAWLRFGGFDFFPDGHSAAICTWNGDVWIVKGIDDKLNHLTWQRYASGLFQALGLKIVNNEIYVLGRDQITRLHDPNGDGEADFYENFNNDCQVSDGFHEFAHDLQVDSQGNFFYAKGGPVNGGGRGFMTLTDDAGCIMKVSPDGKKCEVYATGLRAPDGMSMGPNDQMTVSDNQGTWMPACRISFVTKGAYLGVPDTSHLNPKPDNYGNPICWFPYIDGDYTQGDNSSGGAAWNTLGKWGPMHGRLIHLSYGTCSIFETLIENIDGIWQGGTVRFPLDFDSGIMRARFNPVDGQLYVAGLKGWQTRAAKDGIFQRVRYTGKAVHMPTELHVLKDGLAITFTSPVDPATATDPDNYSIEQWNYIFSSDYGSPDVSRDSPKKKGHDTVDIASITLSPDNKTVMLHIADLKPVMQMKTIMKIKAADGSPMNWELDNTINIVPGQKPIATVQPTTH